MESKRGMGRKEWPIGTYELPYPKLPPHVKQKNVSQIY